MFHLADEIMEMVRFKKLDLFSEVRGGNFDLILYRNVLIYFTKEMQRNLIDNFYESLTWGVILFWERQRRLLEIPSIDMIPSIQ